MHIVGAGKLVLRCAHTDMFGQLLSALKDC